MRHFRISGSAAMAPSAREIKVRIIDGTYIKYQLMYFGLAQYRMQILLSKKVHNILEYNR
jgi:hypothetical protein